jgi:hypothetical protein
MKVAAFVLTMLLSGVVSGQQKPTTGYAAVNENVKVIHSEK